MRRLLSALTMAATAGILLAQDSQPDTTDITADTSVYDQKANLLQYWGNVHLVSPGMLDLTCEYFEVQVGSTGGAPRQITATTNVVMHIVQAGGSGGSVVTNIAYAHQVVFDGSSNVVRLLKSPAGVQPRVEMPEGTANADEIVYDRTSERFHFIGRHQMRLKPGKLQQSPLFKPRTNAPARTPGN